MFTVEFDQATKQRVANMAFNTQNLHVKMRTAMANFFDGEGSDILIRGIRGVLGTSKMGIILSDEYAARKATNPFILHVPGKTPTQPGILSGAIYWGLDARVDVGGITIYVGGVRASTRASTFQRAADPAAYALSIKEAATQPRKPMSTKAQAAYTAARKVSITEYAGILNERSNFMMKGVLDAQKEFADRFEEYITNELSRLLQGGL